MYKKILVHRAAIKWEQKYNELRKKYDKLAYHIIVNKVAPDPKQYSGNALRVDISLTLYPSDTENRLSYDEFIKDITSERIKNEFMAIYNRKK